MFKNRHEAGKLLTQKLREYLSGRREFGQAEVVVVGLPRGGVPVALEVAQYFGCPLEVIAAKKLPFPGQPEYAIGAVSSDGVVVLNPEIPRQGEWATYIDQQRLLLLERTRRTEAELYKQAGYPPAPFAGKVVIIVDDGIATGMTAMAAARAAKLRGAKHTIIAAPVMSIQSFHELHKYCDAVVAVSAPHDFASVGQFYQNFDQTSNEEVIDDMRRSREFALPHNGLAAKFKTNGAEV